MDCRAWWVFAGFGAAEYCLRGPLLLRCGARLARGQGPVTPDRATGLCLDLAGGVFSHVVAAGLDPDGVVHDAVHDRVGVDPGNESLVPILLGVLGAEHC